MDETEHRKKDKTKTERTTDRRSRRKIGPHQPKFGRLLADVAEPVPISAEGVPRLADLGQ